MLREPVHRKQVRHYDTSFQPHELTFSCYRRQAFLTEERVCVYLAEALVDARRRYPFHLWAYVFMPEHVHLLVWPCEEGAAVEGFLRAVKQSVARRATNYLRKFEKEGLKLLATGLSASPYRFWQDGPGYDRNVTCSSTLDSMAAYIHANPVRRRLIAYADDWTWSSARDWSGEGTGPVPLDLESLGW